MMKYLLSFALMIAASSTALARMNGEEVLQDLRAARAELTQPVVDGTIWASNSAGGGDEADGKTNSLTDRKDN